MATSSELIAQMDEARFSAVFLSSPKKVREEIFRRTGIKHKKSGFSLASTNKNAVRTKKLFAAISGGKELTEEIGDELIRNYLYTRRGLLAQALDFFGVEHQEGLTDAELDFMTELEPEKVQELKAALTAEHDPADVELYLRFMKIPLS